MEFLNSQSTIIFAEILKRLGKKEGVTLKNRPYMPICAQREGEFIKTPWGLANLFSICHYSELNGDVMRDPEMCFFVVDNRGDFIADFEKLKIAPYWYQQDWLRIYQASVKMAEKTLTKFHRQLQKRHTDFANVWLANIKAQGFLK